MQNGSSQRPMEVMYPINNDIQITNIQRTPLHEAAISGDEEALKKLLNIGADRNARDSRHGNIPLHEAAWRGYSRCVKALCTLPAPVDVAAPKNRSKTKSSTATKPVSIPPNTVLHASLLSTRNAGGFSPLHLAAQNGHNQSCREILLAGGTPDVQNNYGDTPLHTACRYGHAGATRILLSGKCDPLRINLNGDTAVHIACAMGRRKLTRVLMKTGNNRSLLQIRNAQNETARDIAVRKNLPEIIDILDNPPPMDPIEELEQKKSRDRSRSSSTRHHSADSKKHRTKKVDEPAAAGKETKEIVDPKNWSPYGCHYFPDPRSFPSPRLETLPKEPLATGEQYYLDLAGNIRKGPVGVGNTCYCGPFFRHIEERMSRNKKSIKKYVHRATEKIDHKVQELAQKTDTQIEHITRTILADRIRCDDRREHLEEWLKRGDLTRATVGGDGSKARKDHSNTNTLSRSRSLELLDDTILMDRIDHHNQPLAKSFDLLDSLECSVNRNTAVDLITKSNCRKSSRSSSKVLHRDRRREKSESDKGKHSSPDHINGRLPFEERSDGSKSGYSVAERLEELLSKTHEIIEMGKVSDKRNSFYLLPTDGSEIGPQPRSQLVVKNRSNRKKQSSESSSSLHNRYMYDQQDNCQDTEYIQTEMEKITASLLGTGITEAASGEIDRQPEPADIYEVNGPIPANRSKRSEDYQQSTSFNEEEETEDDEDDETEQNEEMIDDQDEYEDEDQVDGDGTIGSFYHNSSFDDPNSSSTNTVRSLVNAKRKEQGRTASIRSTTKTDETDVDEQQAGPLPEMADMQELNDLKTRILNGSHWKSIVLRKSAQDLNRTTDPKGGLSVSNPSYEIRSGEIKTLKPITESSMDQPTVPKNRVSQLIAKIQAGGAGFNFPRSATVSEILEHLQNDSEDYSSESSDEDEEVSNFDTNQLQVHSEPILSTVEQPPINYRTYVNQNLSQEGPSPNEFQPLTRPDQRTQPSDYHVTQPYRSQVSRIIDTRSLIPKDAYFHDISKRNRLGDSNMNQQNLSNGSVNGRNRNPLPLSIETVDMFHDQAYGSHQPSPSSSSYQPTQFYPNPINYPDTYQHLYYNQPSYHAIPALPYQNHYGPTVDLPKPIPYQEKLLSSRKFKEPIDTLPTELMLTIDQAQIDRDSHNDSGYSTKIYGSSSHASPSLSGHTDSDLMVSNLPSTHQPNQKPHIPNVNQSYLLNGKLPIGQQRPLHQSYGNHVYLRTKIADGRQAAPPSTIENYFVSSNIGASSLV